MTKRKRPWEGERREAPIFFYPPSFARRFYEANLLKCELCCINNTVDPRRGIRLIKFHSGVIRILNVPREEKHGYCRTLSPFSLPVNDYEYGTRQMASFDDVISCREPGAPDGK